uniref:Uncharacterized protein n=1 Tax=Aegilops tauschii subsp. strangulata TaxID=200361 RepID=A0A453B913_AEGTS
MEDCGVIHSWPGKSSSSSSSLLLSIAGLPMADEPPRALARNRRPLGVCGRAGGERATGRRGRGDERKREEGWSRGVERSAVVGAVSHPPAATVRVSGLPCASRGFLLLFSPHFCGAAGKSRAVG